MDVLLQKINIEPENPSFEDEISFCDGPFSANMWIFLFFIFLGVTQLITFATKVLPIWLLAADPDAEAVVRKDAPGRRNDLATMGGGLWHLWGGLDGWKFQWNEMMNDALSCVYINWLVDFWLVGCFWKMVKFIANINQCLLQLPSWYFCFFIFIGNLHTLM